MKCDRFRASGCGAEPDGAERERMGGKKGKGARGKGKNGGRLCVTAGASGIVFYPKM